MAESEPLNGVPVVDQREPRDDAASPLAHDALKKHPAQQPVERPISRDMIIRALEKQNVRFPIGIASDTNKILAKQTHLHLNNLRVNCIGKALPAMQQLETLYLYDNAISTMEGFLSCKMLTHLYLQNNDIELIEGISGLLNLSKLYLQGNRIALVSGLSQLPSLEELHLSGQRLPPDSSGLSFDLRTMLSVSSTLRVLVAVDCGIGDGAAASLPPMPQLRKLVLSGNQMEIIECLDVVVKSASRLLMAELHDNPFCRDQPGEQRYRDAMILMSDSLASLDGESITAQQRSFLLRLHIKKLKSQVAVDQGEEDCGPGSAAPEAGRPALGATGSRSMLRQEQPRLHAFAPPTMAPRGPGFSSSGVRAGCGSGPGFAASGSRAVASSGLRGPSAGPPGEPLPSAPPVPSAGSRGRSPSIPSKPTTISLGMDGVRIN